MDTPDTMDRGRRALDTPAGLRRRAAEFLRVAAGARDPVAWGELHRLAELYLEQANELEGGASPRSGNEQRNGRLRVVQGGNRSS
jgi:hypothetical protein